MPVESHTCPDRVARTQKNKTGPGRGKGREDPFLLLLVHVSHPLFRVSRGGEGETPGHTKAGYCAQSEEEEEEEEPFVICRRRVPASEEEGGGGGSLESPTGLIPTKP